MQCDVVLMMPTPTYQGSALSAIGMSMDRPNDQAENTCVFMRVLPDTGPGQPMVLIMTRRAIVLANRGRTRVSRDA